MHSTLRSASRAARGLHRTASRRIWGLSTHTAPANTPAEASRIQRWSARLSLENTYLSFTRNAIICTVAGGALIQYQKSEGKPPLAGAGLLLMGGGFMYIGSATYIQLYFHLRHPLRLGWRSIVWAVLNAAAPASLYTLAIMCVLDEYPTALLEGLRRFEGHLPTLVRASLFIDPPALYPACVLLKGVLDHERPRLQIVRRHAEGHWSLAKPKRVQGLLADKDVASIIVRRIERLDYLRNTLNKYAKAERAVPTAYVAPILAKLQTELSLLEDILETDLAPNESLGGQTVAGYTLWFFASTASSEHKAMRNELEAVRMLGRRLAAIKYTAIEFAARGQLGVKQGTPEEAALDTSKL